MGRLDRTLLTPLLGLSLAGCWVTDSERASWEASGGWSGPGVGVEQTDWTGVAAGRFHACGLHEDGSVECWCDGLGDDGQCDAPTGAFASIAAHGDYTCAMGVDGDVACWGAEDVSLTPPSGSFVEVGLGGTLACGVGSDGWLTCWGLGDPFRLAAQDVPVSNIAVGEDGQVCGLDQDGAIQCWCDVYGGTYGWVCEPPEGAFRQVSLGCNFGCAIGLDGTTECWGTGCGQDVGEHDAPDGLVTVQLEGKGGCGLTEAGGGVCWGGSDLESVPPGDLLDIDRGGSQACAVTDAGLVRCWGTGASQP